MDAGKGQGYPGRRTREERRSLSESLADGTSKFFSSMVAKKNGLFSDISSKIENTFAPKTDTLSNSTGSDKSVSPPSTPPAVPHTPPPRPPPPKRLPSMGSSREKENNVMKRMASMPTYTRSDSRPEYGVPDMTQTASSRKNNGRASISGTGEEERLSMNGMNISFDEPIYTKTQAEPVRNQSTGSIKDSDIPNPEANSQRSRHMSGAAPNASTGRPVAQPRPAPRTQKPDKPQEPVVLGARVTGGLPGEDYGQGYGPTTSSSDEFEKRHGSNGSRTPPRTEGRGRKSGSRNSMNERSDSGASGASGSGSGNETGGTNTSTRQKAPKFTTTKRRSSTVDEILFDDYVEPEVDTVIPAEPPENLISFEPDLPPTSSPGSSPDSGGRLHGGASVDSSDAEFGGTALHRSGSVGSDKSWSSNYSVDSQPDDVTLECMEFMKSFVDNIFHNSDEITQTEKAKFGELCQYFPGRLWFSRYVNSQRVNNKKVTEPVFFSLMQYFAVCLFECNEAEDFSPAKTLMNMCFTFYYEGTAPNGNEGKVFLYTYMRDQPIWQSLRFWNAAFFDAVQCERSRRPMPTNSDGSETRTDDKQFQENITFGQLGVEFCYDSLCLSPNLTTLLQTFACNMRSFGLSKELCLEFLRKQSTIANLRKDQVRLLRENIDKVKEP